jgi:hypothetical protein
VQDDIILDTAAPVFSSPSLIDETAGISGYTSGSVIYRVSVAETGSGLSQITVGGFATITSVVFGGDTSLITNVENPVITFGTGAGSGALEITGTVTEASNTIEVTAASDKAGNSTAALSGTAYIALDTDAPAISGTPAIGGSLSAKTITGLSVSDSDSGSGLPATNAVTIDQGSVTRSGSTITLRVNDALEYLAAIGDSVTFTLTTTDNLGNSRAVARVTVERTATGTAPGSFSIVGGLVPLTAPFSAPAPRFSLAPSASAASPGGANASSAAPGLFSAASSSSVSLAPLPAGGFYPPAAPSASLPAARTSAPAAPEAASANAPSPVSANASLTGVEEIAARSAARDIPQADMAAGASRIPVPASEARPQQPQAETAYAGEQTLSEAATERAARPESVTALSAQAQMKAAGTAPRRPEPAQPLPRKSGRGMPFLAPAVFRPGRQKENDGGDTE